MQRSPSRKCSAAPSRKCSAAPSRKCSAAPSRKCSAAPSRNAAQPQVVRSAVHRPRRGYPVHRGCHLARGALLAPPARYPGLLPDRTSRALVGGGGVDRSHRDQHGHSHKHPRLRFRGRPDVSPARAGLPGGAGRGRRRVAAAVLPGRSAQRLSARHEPFWQRRGTDDGRPVSGHPFAVRRVPPVCHRAGVGRHALDDAAGRPARRQPGGGSRPGRCLAGRIDRPHRRDHPAVHAAGRHAGRHLDRRRPVGRVRGRCARRGDSSCWERFPAAGAR